MQRFWLALLLVIGGGVLGRDFAFPAAAETSEEVEAIQDEIAKRKSSIDLINKRLEEYRKRIAEYSSQSASLANDIALIENEAAMAELDIAATQNEIDAENLELKITEQRMEEASEDLAQQQEMLSTLIFELHKQDEKGLMEMFFGAENFHDVFSNALQLESVNEQLQKTLAATKSTKEDLETQQARHQENVEKLVELGSELQGKVDQLDIRKTAKEVLVQQTEESEGEYRVLMSELRQEQQSVTSEIASLQAEMQSKIDSSDSAGDGSVITWPAQGRITAIFHDPTYPFRHLFEHTGLDIAVPQGTPLEAAAPGYVAWARQGQTSGNYVVILHADGLSTYYGHMSRLDVKADQYVTRGQIIGLSGGRPGTPGAGFSTGPHVHFEVRKGGIPVNPMSYLVDVE